MKIKYNFVTGEVKEIIVPEEISKISIEIDRGITSSERRESRRHNSLEKMEEWGFQFMDEKMDVEIIAEEKLVMESLYEALGKLSFEKRKLIGLVFFERETITSIAKKRGVTEGAIRKELNKIYREIEKILK